MGAAGQSYHYSQEVDHCELMDEKQKMHGLILVAQAQVVVLVVGSLDL